MTSHSHGALRPSFSFHFRPLQIRGRREDRVRAAPAVSCAKCTKENAHEHTGSAETLRPSPRNGFTAYSALSPVTGFLATVAMRIAPHNLTPASGRQDHTISPSASVPFVKGTSASTASHRAFRDDREPPLLSGETGGVKPLICPTTEAKYFSKGGWTGFR
ncbi:MAG: hypothetical protein QOJ17_2272 [Rhodospirillaceae bacterium]|nr:hypothetical protein [Rhodospirillaceae bacterium]